MSHALIQKPDFTSLAQDNLKSISTYLDLKDSTNIIKVNKALAREMSAILAEDKRFKKLIQNIKILAPIARGVQPASDELFRNAVMDSQTIALLPEGQFEQIIKRASDRELRVFSYSNPLQEVVAAEMRRRNKVALWDHRTIIMISALVSTLMSYFVTREILENPHPQNTRIQNIFYFSSNLLAFTALFMSILINLLVTYLIKTKKINEFYQKNFNEPVAEIMSVLAKGTGSILIFFLLNMLLGIGIGADTILTKTSIGMGILFFMLNNITAMLLETIDMRLGLSSFVTMPILEKQENPEDVSHPVTLAFKAMFANLESKVQKAVRDAPPLESYPYSTALWNEFNQAVLSPGSLGVNMAEVTGAIASRIESRDPGERAP